MKMFRSEEDLLAALDKHDDLVFACASGAIPFEQFERAYDSFYWRCALDGHESDEEERALFARHASRISFHAELCETVLSRLTTDEYAAVPECAAKGFIGRGDAVVLLRELVARTRQTG